MAQPKNKQEVAYRKEQYERKVETKNPLMRITYLLNQYHSVDHRYSSDQEKSSVKKILESEIVKNIDTLDKKMKPMFVRAIKNKGEWEHLRNLIV